MFFSDDKEMATIEGTVFNRPPTSFDPVLGYRWNQGVRFVRVARGEILASLHPKINAQGFHCSFDYRQEKPSGRAYRIIALGDSFTNDIACETAWPEAMHRFLRSRHEHGVEVEVYGMPTDGGGLLNWYTVLKEYVIPNYEVDCIVIADWGDDLYRPWAHSHSTDTEMLWGRVELADRPKNLDDLLANADNMRKLYEVRSDEQIDYLLANLRKHAAPQPVAIDYGPAPRVIPPGYEFGPRSFGERYGADRFDVLAEIMSLCREHGIDVIWSELPEHGDLHCLIDHPGEKTFRQAQGEWIAEHFDVSWFDGCAIFGDIPARSLIDFYWLKYDGHWNLAASTYYAMRLADWIVSQGMVQR